MQDNWWAIESSGVHGGDTYIIAVVHEIDSYLPVFPSPMSEVYPLADIKEEASASGLISRQASDPTLNNEKRHYENDHPPPRSPPPHHISRRMSRASRVSVDFFDPEGMAQLQRTLTGQDGKIPQVTRQESVSSFGSDHTLTVDPDHFDLEKTIRQIIRRYAVSFLFIPSALH